MLKLLTPQWSFIWRVLFKKTAPINLNGWRCTVCNTDRHYIEGVLVPGCSERRISSEGHAIACPLVPLDDAGRELSFEQWQDARCTAR